jgi:HPt (histidine-containing phosphotransfer) domain-containing protein
VTAAAEARWDQVRQAAHKLAGLCLTMGGQALARRLRAVASAARAGDTARVREEVAGLDEIAETTRTAALRVSEEVQAS